MATPGDWIKGARPQTLPAAIAPVLVGTAAAYWIDAEVWWKAALALAVSLLLQIGVNYANDYSDGIRGTDDDRVGPMRLVGSGRASARSVKAAAFTCFGLAAVVGLVLAATTNWWLVAIGAVCILAAWFYTGGSKPYGYLGLGEVMVFVFFGLVAVLGTMWVQAEQLTLAAWYGAVAIGCLACLILVANNLRDIPTDTESGKHTLAVRLGEERTRYLFAFLAGVWLVGTIGFLLATTNLAAIGLVAILPLQRAVRIVLRGTRGAALVPVIRLTASAEWMCAVGILCGVVGAGAA